MDENGGTSQSTGRGATEDVQSELRHLSPFLLPLFLNSPLKDISPLEAMLRFNQVFHARYPASTLDFFVGELREAMVEVLAGDMPGPSRAHTSEKQRMLALYLHDDNLDRTIAAHIFPQQVLSDELVLSVLEENYIPWAWDVIEARYYDLLKAQMTSAGLTAVWEAVAQLPQESYPLLVVVRAPDSVVYVAKGRQPTDNISFPYISTGSLNFRNLDPRRSRRLPGHASRRHHHALLQTRDI